MQRSPEQILLEHIKSVREMHGDKIAYLKNNDTPRKIFFLLQDIGKSATREIMERYKKSHEDLDRGTINRRLNDLEKRGLVTGDPSPGKRQGRTTRWQINEELSLDEFIFLQDLQTLSLAIKQDLNFFSDDQVNTYGFPLDYLKESLKDNDKDNEKYGKNVREWLDTILCSIQLHMDILLALSESLTRRKIRKEIGSLENEYDRALAAIYVYCQFYDLGKKKKWFDQPEQGGPIKIKADLELRDLIGKYLWQSKSKEKIWDEINRYKITGESLETFEKIQEVCIRFINENLFVVAHSPKFIGPTIEAGIDKFEASGEEVEDFGLGPSEETKKEFVEWVRETLEEVGDEEEPGIDEFMEEVLP